MQRDRRRFAAVGAITVLLCTACAAPPATRELAKDALVAMGGVERVRAVRSLVMKEGSGARWRLGQGVKPGDGDVKAALTDVTETLDLVSGRAALDYTISMNDGFTERRQEILTRHGERAVGLERVGGRPLTAMSESALFSWGTQNTPTMALRRNIVTVALAALRADATQLAEDRDLEGRRVKFGRVPLKDETIGVYFDRTTKLIAAYEATDTEAMLGDVTARYLLDDYRAVGGVLLPHQIRIIKGGAPYAEVRFASAAINDAAALTVFEVPAEVADSVAQVAASANDYSPLTLTPIADGVFFAQAYSHHSLVVEFPSYLAVVEAPYTEAQSRTLVRLLATRFPGKPVRYAAVTHPHYDHIGGVRGLAAAGATILVTHAHERVVRAVLDARHTNPADALDTNRKTGGKAGSLRIYDGDRTIAEGAQSLELHAITGSPHADPIVLAYVPSAHLLFQSDLFFPGTGARATPAAVQLLQAVRRLKLDVQTNAGGHGGVAPFDELVTAAAAATH